MMTFGYVNRNQPSLGTGCVEAANTIPCPFDVIIMIDTSKSMEELVSGKRKIDYAKDAAKSFVDYVANSDQKGQIRIGVVAFQNFTSLNSIPQTDYGQVKNKINTINAVASNTCISCGLKSALDDYSMLDSPKNPTIILLSDGGSNIVIANPNVGEMTGTQQAKAHQKAIIEDMEYSNRLRNMSPKVSIYTIGISAAICPPGMPALLCYDPDHLYNLTGRTPGHFFDNPIASEWQNIFIGIATGGSVCLPTPTPTPPATATPVPSATPTPTPIPIEPWIMTMNGDVFSNKFDFSVPSSLTVVSGVGSPSYMNGKPAYKSTYLYLKNNDNLNNKSFKSFDNTGRYTDLNFKPRQDSSGSNWFEFLKKKVNFSQKFSKHSLNSPTITQRDISTFLAENSIFAGDKNIVNINGTGKLTINSNVNCNTKVVFISEDLEINANITDTNTSGCLFLVSGTTTINAGENRGSGGATSGYDEINAFIITNKIVVESDVDGDGLLIKGGLILMANTNSSEIKDTSEFNDFSRVLPGDANQFAPSEAIYYDGTKYMYIFDDLLNYKRKYTIREKQFVDSQN